MTTSVEAATERHRAIADRLESAGRVEVGELAARLEVAPETIRRDLRLLEQQGLLQRVHGGAVRKPDHPLSPFDGESPEYPDHHRRLADRVVLQLPERGALYLDASPLTAAVADALARRVPGGPAFTVVTTSLDVAVMLSKVDRLSVFNVGGTVNQADRSQQGDWALAELHRLRTDLALITADGVTTDGGLFSNTALGAAMTTAAVAATDAVWLLVDADRLGRPGLMSAAPLARVDRVFVAGRPDAAVSRHFAEYGADVCCETD